VYPELYVYSGNIAGSGQVVKRGSGALWLRGENSYSGGTLIEDGILVGNDRSLRGTIVNNSGLAFYQSADGTYAGSTSGGGVLLKYGPGNLTLAGINTHSGGTAFSGPLTVGDDRNLGAPSAAVIIAGGTLRTAASMTSARPFGIAPDGATFDTQAHSLTLMGPVSGPGALTKTGPGTLSLVGAHSFTGGTHVQAGMLALEGSLASALTLASGTRLSGTGTVAGPVSLAPGATFVVRVDASGNASDIVAQSAQIDGASLQVNAQPGQYRPRTAYTILTTGAGLAGRFVQTTIDLPFLTPQLQYGPNRVGLTLSRNDSSWQSIAHTSSQRDIAGALERLARSNDADVQLIADTLNG
jgi:autotransporter-associated beta strand protein